MTAAIDQRPSFQLPVENIEQPPLLIDERLRQEIKNKVADTEIQVTALFKQCLSETWEVKDNCPLKKIQYFLDQLNELIITIKNLVKEKLSTNSEALEKLKKDQDYQELRSLTLAIKLQLEEIKHPSLSLKATKTAAEMNEELKEIRSLSDRKEQLARLKIYMSQQFKRVSIYADGDCLFLAVNKNIDLKLISQNDSSESLTRSASPSGSPRKSLKEEEEEKAFQLRTSLVKFMKDNRSDYEAFCKASPHLGEEQEVTFEQYLDELSKKKSYGDEPELAALANMLKCRIYTYNLDKTSVNPDKKIEAAYIHGDKYKADPATDIHLFKYNYPGKGNKPGEGHYDLLLPKVN